MGTTANISDCCIQYHWSLAELHWNENVKRIWVCVDAASVPIKALKWLLSLIYPFLEKTATQQVSFLICMWKSSHRSGQILAFMRSSGKLPCISAPAGFLVQEAEAKSELNIYLLFKVKRKKVGMFSDLNFHIVLSFWNPDPKTYLGNQWKKRLVCCLLVSQCGPVLGPSPLMAGAQDFRKLLFQRIITSS